jgi:hypothetical protein
MSQQLEAEVRTAGVSVENGDVGALLNYLGFTKVNKRIAGEPRKSWVLNSDVLTRHLQQIEGALEDAA